MKQFSCGEIVPGYKIVPRAQLPQIIVRPAVTVPGKKETGMRISQSSRISRISRRTVQLPAVA